MKRIILGIIAFLILIICTSCSKETSYFYRYEYNGYLDTIGYIIVEYSSNDYPQEDVFHILNEVKTILLNIEKEFSVSKTPYMEEENIEKSTVMLINERSGENIDTLVSDEFLDLLDLSILISGMTNGLFDVSIGSLTKLWNISSRAEYCADDSEFLEYLCSIPDTIEINKTLELVDYKNINIDYENKTVSLPKKGMALDFGAIAKGYAVEKIAEYLQKFNFSYVIINMGGNVKVVGEAKQNIEPLKIQVKAPFKDGNIGYYYPKDSTGGVTSGIYERYINYKGVKYHHILNPKTGYPSDEDIVSVTIVGTDSSVSDALSTSVFMLGVERGLKLINSLEDYEAIIITKDEKIYISNNLEFIQINNKI